MSFSKLTEKQEKKLIKVIDYCEDFYIKNKRRGKYTPDLWKCIITFDHEDVGPMDNYRYAGQNEEKWVAINEALNRALEELEETANVS